MPSPVRSRYYPWIIFTILLVLTQFSLFPLVSAMIVGSMHTRKLLDWTFAFAPAKVESCEHNCAFSAISDLKGFTTAFQGEEYAASSGENLPNYDRNSGQSIRLVSAPVPQNAFVGRGVAVEKGKEAKRVTRESRLVKEHERTDSSQNSDVERKEEKQANSVINLVNEYES